MKTDGSTKSNIKVINTEEKENLPLRKSLKTLQQSADKENLAGRTVKYSKDKLKPEHDDMSDSELIELKKKKIVSYSKAVQTIESFTSRITADDLTSEAGPSEKYWEVLAEKRRVALENSLAENRQLCEEIELLRNENDTLKESYKEAKHLVEILTEMLDEKEGGNTSNETQITETSGVHDLNDEDYNRTADSFEDLEKDNE